MKLHHVVTKHVYRWHPNGGRAYKLVRVLRNGGGDWFTVRGPNKREVPYNYATASELTHPTRDELQAFLKDMT